LEFFLCLRRVTDNIRWSLQRNVYIYVCTTGGRQHSFELCIGQRREREIAREREGDIIRFVHRASKSGFFPPFCLFDFYSLFVFSSVYTRREKKSFVVIILVSAKRFQLIPIVCFDFAITTNHWRTEPLSSRAKRSFCVILANSSVRAAKNPYHSVLIRSTSAAGPIRSRHAAFDNFYENNTTTAVGDHDRPGCGGGVRSGPGRRSSSVRDGPKRETTVLRGMIRPGSEFRFLVSSRPRYRCDPGEISVVESLRFTGRNAVRTS